MAKKQRGMTKRQTQLELANILQADAAEIIAAREKGRIIHHTLRVTRSSRQFVALFGGSYQ